MPTLPDDIRAVLDAARRTSADRDAARELPYETIADLARLGLTSITVPKEYGGQGASIPELFDTLIELAAADANLAQALRAHFWLVEWLRSAPRTEHGAQLLRDIAAGTVLGNATHERSGAEVGRLSTKLTRTADGYRLNGTKFYTTGSLFASYIAVLAEHPDEGRVTVLVERAADGIEVRDDWDGFGQKGTASGTAIFSDVAVDESALTTFPADAAHVTAFVELVLLATLAGIAQAVERDAVEFVQTRTRNYAHSTADLPRHDPIVQEVIGELAAASRAARALVRDAARELAAASDAVAAAAGSPDDADARAAAEAAVDAAERAAVEAQITLVPLVLDACSRLFEVGGASATSTTRSLDRHWRNARTVASHNPTRLQARAIGDHLLNAAGLVGAWDTGEAKQHGGGAQ